MTVPDGLWAPVITGCVTGGLAFGAAFVGSRSSMARLSTLVEVLSVEMASVRDRLHTLSNIVTRLQVKIDNGGSGPHYGQSK